MIHSWDDVEVVFRHAFYNELRVSPEEHPVLVAEPLVIPGKAREKLAEMMFEVFDVPAYLPSSPAPLALFFAGRSSGVVLDCGSRANAAVAVHEGRPLWDTYSQSLLGGDAITRNVVAVTSNSGFSWTSQATSFVLPEAIKEKTCMVSPTLLGDTANRNPHLWRELRASRRYFDDAGADSYLSVLPPEIRFELHKYCLGPGVPYEFPDGQLVYLQNDTVRIPEPLFAPPKNGAGLTDLVARACSAPHDVHKAIVLVGGTTLFPGFAERLRHELAAVKPDCKVLPLDDARLATWIGGSVVATLPAFTTSAVLQSEYTEMGPGAVWKKDCAHLCSGLL